MANGLLAFGTGLMILATAISAVLATYFLRKSSYKNAEAAAIFAGIFAFATLVFFIYLQVTENSEITKLRTALAAGASGAKQAFTEGYQVYYPPKQQAAPAVVAQPAVANPAGYVQLQANPPD